MKRKVIFTMIIASIIIFAGCKKDNFDPPKSFLTGTVVYNSTPVSVRSNGTQLELWQYTWPTKGVVARAKIAVYIAQDGTYSARLFDGNYKLVRLAGAPWANQTDSIDITVKGNTVVDVPVTPYYTISGEIFNYTVADSTITATCSVTKVGASAISNLTLYVSTSNIVDANNNLQSIALDAAALSDLTTLKTIKVRLSKSNGPPSTWTTLNGRTYIYARLGVATSGVGERFYTPVQKITLQ